MYATLGEDQISPKFIKPYYLIILYALSRSPKTVLQQSLTGRQQKQVKIPGYSNFDLFGQLYV
jgi:hypothetical protein